jgi:hypothetical protein
VLTTGAGNDRQNLIRSFLSGDAEDPFPAEKPVPRMVGLTVFRVAGVWWAKAWPADCELAAADRVYAGGHVHTVDQAGHDELIPAGFGAYLTPIP